MNTSYQKKYNRVIPVVTLIIMIIVFVFSYSFIIQPHYDAPNDEIVTNHLDFEFSQNNSYLVKNSDNSYSLYIDNQYFGNIDTEKAEILLNDDFSVKTLE